MKHNLLLTTALTALFATNNVWAEGNTTRYIYNGDMGKVTVENKTSPDVTVWNSYVVFVNPSASVGNGSLFRNNEAGVGGAISVPTSADLSVTGTVFENNHARYDGGAIGNYGALTISNSIFKNNTAQLIGENYDKVQDDSLPVGGGAISLGAVSSSKIASISDTSFINNVSGKNGGAIGTRLGKDANNSGATVDIAANFEKNHAYANGGAIYNTFYANNSQGKGDGVTVSGKFTENRADMYGGAIYNDGAKDKAGNFGGIMTFNDTTFTNNTAKEGGAIYNSENAVLNLAGTSVFSGNKAGEKLNDIHNLGTLNVSGDLTLDGGISGNGKTIFAKGTNVSVKVNGTEISNDVVNNGATLNLVFANDFEGTYQLVTGSLDKEFSGFDNNALYKIESVANGKYQVSKKSTEELTDSLGTSENKANAVAALTAGAAENNDAFNSIADNIGEMLQSAQPEQVSAALNAVEAMSPDIAPVVQSTQTEMVNQVFNAVSSRLSSGSVASANEGMASGDSLLERGTVWVKGLYNRAKLDDDTSKDIKGFTSKSYGVAFGAEKFVTDDVKAGVGYAYTDTEIDGFLRDTDVDTHTAFVYGEYKPANWFVNAAASYNWSEYKEKRNVLDYQVGGDYDADTIALQVMGGYDFHVGTLKLTPEAGLRYLSIKQDAYTDTVGNRVGESNSDILTGILGAKVSRSFAYNNFVLRPELRAAATYDLSNDDASSYVVLANGASYQANGEALKRFGVEIGAGVTAELSDNVELTAAYEGRFREDYYDNTGMLSAKYKF